MTNEESHTHPRSMATPPDIKARMIEVLTEVTAAVQEADCICQLGMTLIVLHELSEVGMSACYNVITEARRTKAEEN